MIKRYVLCIYKSGNDKQQCDTRMVAYQIIITTEKERLHWNYAISIQMNKAIVNIKLYLAYNDLSKGNMKIETYPFACNLMYT